MFPRELKWLHVETGHTVAGVLEEVGQIPLDQQDPRLVARALASARLLDDPDCALAWPAAFGRMSARLDALHERADE